jgi:uncharacterized protein
MNKEVKVFSPLFFVYIRNMKSIFNARVFASLAVGLCVVLSAYVFMKGYRDRNGKDNVIHVTGMGSRNFDSDLIVWRGSFSKTSNDLAAASAALESDRNTIKNYLVGKGIQENEIVFSAMEINKNYSNIRNSEGDIVGSELTGYSLSQMITIESSEVAKVEQISREVTELIASGVEFYSESPEFYYTKLAELKIEMVSEATADARLRAEKIALSSESHLGNLQNAEMGIFQIVGQNSDEDYSWGGAFNTSSRRKTASITMQLNFEID